VIVAYKRSWHGRPGKKNRDLSKRKKKEQKERNGFGRGKPVETAAAMEIKKGGLRRHFLNRFPPLLANPAGFRTVPTGSATVDFNKPKPDRSFATKTGHFNLLPTFRDGLTQAATDAEAAFIDHIR
jgi:hypothetical protein